MLARLFQGQQTGFYVDIGAWDPTLHSVTRHFYDMGWSGVNVEPIASHFQRFVVERPRDINIQAAVGSRTGRLRFFECKDLTALSTADEAQAKTLIAQGRSVEAYDVDVITVDSLSRTIGDRTVDFLKIDVEGYEEQVIAGANLRAFRPRILLIEATLPDTQITDWDRIDAVRNWDGWEPAVLAAGYRFAWYDGLSRFYLREEDAALARRLLLPAGVHDDISWPDADRLRAELSAVDDDRQQKAAVVDRLVVEIDALKSDQQAKQVALDAADADLAQRARDLASLQSRLAQREQYCADLEERLTQAQRRRQAVDEVIAGIAAETVERRSLFGGVADLAWRYRRRGTPTGSGVLHHQSREASGLHVAVDALEIVFGVSGGVETYMKMLVAALIHGGYRVTIICLPDQLEALRRLFGADVGYFVVRLSRAIDLGIRAARKAGRTQSRQTPALSLATFHSLDREVGADILHSPVQIFSRNDFSLPAVLNLHDLQHLHFPENFRQSDIDARNHLYGLSSTLAGAIIVSSDFVRNDLIERMRVPGRKVFTIPVTWDPRVEEGLRTFDVEAARRHYRLPQTYALYPAQFWPHKNHVSLVQALAILKRVDPGHDLKLVFTGYRGHSGWPRVDECIRAEGLQEDVICLDHIPVDHLGAVYRGARFCVVPSLFEASSYPVIEAQVLGVPAMCARVTSLPELVQDGAGELFDPRDPDDLAHKMLAWLRDPEAARAHARRALDKVRRDHSLTSFVAGLDRVYQFAKNEANP